MVHNVETGVDRRATTDERGRYFVSPLAIGHYTLTAEASGFRTVNVSDIYLTIGQTGVKDITMQSVKSAKRSPLWTPRRCCRRKMLLLDRASKTKKSWTCR